MKGEEKNFEAVRWDGLRVSREVMPQRDMVERWIQSRSENWVRDQGWGLVGTPRIVHFYSAEQIGGFTITFGVVVEMLVIKP